MIKNLNLGCGKDIKSGWVNIDVAQLEGVDKVVDLNSMPWPFEDEEFDYILCNDVLEHLNDIVAAMSELHRISKKGGTTEIRVPHYTAADAYSDPLHKRAFSSQSFQFFLKGNNRAYYFDFYFSEASINVTFVKKFPLFYNLLLQPIVNISNRTRRLYELSFLSAFPALNVHVLLIK